MIASERQAFIGHQFEVADRSKKHCLVIHLLRYLESFRFRKFGSDPFMQNMNKDRVAEALELFESGYNCSQTVLGVFCDELDLSRETAFKIASPFGGGFGGYGKACGALTGAMMVIGLRYGNSKGNDLESKKLSRDMTRKFLEAFEQAHGSCVCNDLLGLDRSHLSGPELQAIQPCIREKCPKLLVTAITLLEEEF